MSVPTYYMKKRITCSKCNELAEHHAKEMCFNCYRKFAWKRKKKTCKRCKRQMPIHAKGYCSGCYNYVFYLEETKAWNYEKRHKIPAKLYLKLTKKCLVCGFDKYVVLHHLDENHQNSDEKNLIGLCPNHHQLVHTLQYKEEVLSLIREKLDERALPVCVEIVR